MTVRSLFISKKVITYDISTHLIKKSTHMCTIINIVILIYYLFHSKSKMWINYIISIYVNQFNYIDYKH